MADITGAEFELMVMIALVTMANDKDNDNDNNNNRNHKKNLGFLWVRGGGVCRVDCGSK